ncbi:MAG: DNA-3-methyladenine glycosylase [Gammaproteobacteria bacterium]
MKSLPRDFYDRSAIEVAPDLLGKYLVREIDGAQRVGRIVEVEAYLGEHDKAAHSSKGLTPRTRVMFGPPGHAYVYMIYGLHFCMNVVVGEEGEGAAVLVRAVEPVAGIESRTCGPALLCKAMGIDKRFNGHDLLSPDLYLAASDRVESLRIVKRPRIGVDYAGAWARRLLRFYIKGNAYISRP